MHIGMVLGLGVIALIFVLIRKAMADNKQRIADLKQYSLDKGFTFNEKDDVTRMIDVLPNTPLFSAGRNGRVKNIMTGNVEDLEVYIFDYQYTTGSGKNRTTTRQTVFAIRKEGLRLPHFSLHPENFLHRFISKFGFQDIDFDDFPVFSEKYLLRGEDESAIRNTFTSDILSFYENDFSGITEGNGDFLIYCKPYHVLKPDQYDAELTLALKRFMIFNPPAG